MIFWAFYKRDGLELLAAVRTDCLCWVAPIVSGDRSAALAALQAYAGTEHLQPDEVLVVARLQAALDWSLARKGGKPVLDFGPATPFQRQVWQALLEILPGIRVTYGELARRLGRPGAARAVGRAAGSNRIAVVVPCHRLVARQAIGGYHWGMATKRALLARERECVGCLTDAIKGI